MLEYAKGNAEAFKLLYSRYKQPLYQFMLNSCSNDALAQELFQDVWTKLINARLSYQADTPFKAWLFRIARNHLTDHYRRHNREKRDVPLNDDEAATDKLWGQAPLSPERVAQLSQQGSALQEALSTLPVVQREAVVLKHVAGMSLDEIAALQEEGVQTIKSRLRYAVKKLRSQLEKPS